MLEKLELIANYSGEQLYLANSHLILQLLQQLKMKQCVDAKCSFETQKPKPIKVQEDYLKRYTKNIAE